MLVRLVRKDGDIVVLSLLHIRGLFPTGPHETRIIFGSGEQDFSTIPMALDEVQKIVEAALVKTFGAET